MHSMNQVRPMNETICWKKPHLAMPNLINSKFASREILKFFYLSQLQSSLNGWLFHATICAKIQVMLMHIREDDVAYVVMEQVPLGIKGCWLESKAP